LASLGITAFQQGKYEQADVYYEEGMINSRALNHAVMISLLHCYQGLLALVRGNVASARDSFHAGLKLAHEGDIKAYVIYNLVGCANAHLAENKTSLAVKLLGTSTAIADAIGFKMEPEIKGPYERAIATAKEKLGEDEFSAAWIEGLKMTPDQVIDFELKGRS